MSMPMPVSVTQRRKRLLEVTESPAVMLPCVVNFMAFSTKWRTMYSTRSRSVLTSIDVSFDINSISMLGLVLLFEHLATHCSMRATRSNFSMLSF